jgi:fucose permease
MTSGVKLICSFFVHLGIILILILGVYSDLSGRVRTVYLVSLCVVSLLSSRFAASALVWAYNFRKYLVFHFLFRWALCSFVDLHESYGCSCTNVRSEWIGEGWRISMLELEVVPHR